MRFEKLPGGLSTLDIKDICSVAQRLISKNCDGNNTEPCFRVLNCEDVSKNDDEIPSGFLSVHNFLRIDYETTSGKSILEVFVKSAPSVQSRLDYVNNFGVFDKEVAVFKMIAPILGVDEVLPKCYFATTSALVFEDLVARGYSNVGGREAILDFPHLDCALKALAKMHGHSIVLEKVKGINIANEYRLSVEENAYPITDQPTLRHTNFRNAIDAMLEMIKVMPEYQCSPRLEFILQNVYKEMSNIFQMVQTSTKYQNVFSHGDLWANNVMFLEKDGIPVDCKLIDFQLARYCPPIIDILTILSIPTTRQFRQNHLEKLINNYYEYLTQTLQKHSLDIRTVLPKDQFYSSFKEFEIIGIIESFLFTHMTALPSELSKDLTQTAQGFEQFFFGRKKVCLKAFTSDKLYRDRLTDIIYNFVEVYVLKNTVS